MSEKFDPNNPEHVMKRYGWSRKEFDKRMGIVEKYESQLTPLAADSPTAHENVAALLEINRARVALDFDSLSEKQYQLVCHHLQKIESALQGTANR